MIIYVDADACPVKDEVYSVAQRYALPVILVANAGMRVPAGVELVRVGDAIDAADDWIAEHITHEDIVISSDILLAARCVEKGAAVLGPTGVEFDADSIGDVVAMRELMSHLRETGASTGGPPPFQKRDRSRFLQRLDTLIQRTRRREPGGTRK